MVQRKCYSKCVGGFFSATSLSISFMSFDATGICRCSQQAIAVFCVGGKQAVGAGRISRVCLGFGDSCWERPEIKEKWCQALDFQDRDVCFYGWDFIQVGYTINGLTPTLASWEQLVSRTKLMLPSGYQNAHSLRGRINEIGCGKRW